MTMLASKKIKKTDTEWKKELPLDVYEIMRGQGTEAPFSGELLYNKERGVYLCAACGNELFSSDTKYDSGSGWPSFWSAVRENAVEFTEDRRGGISRTEVKCARCGGHLGHIFTDGPKPTGKRYCVNSLALKFDKEKSAK